LHTLQDLILWWVRYSCTVYRVIGATNSLRIPTAATIYKSKYQKHGPLQHRPLCGSHHETLESRLLCQQCCAGMHQASAASRPASVSTRRAAGLQLPSPGSCRYPPPTNEVRRFVWLVVREKPGRQLHRPLSLITPKCMAACYQHLH
jgi:hypothetical protein